MSTPALESRQRRGLASFQAASRLRYETWKRRKTCPLPPPITRALSLPEAEK